jgi:hypothetical protein
VAQKGKLMNCGHFNTQPFGCENCGAGPEEVLADLKAREEYRAQLANESDAAKCHVPLTSD